MTNHSNEALKQRPDLDAILQSICPEIDPILLKYARERRGELGLWTVELPGRQVIWRDEAADFTVSLMTNLTSPYRMDIWGSAWRTNLIGDTRHAVHLPPKVFEGPVKGINFQTAIEEIHINLLKAARVLLGLSRVFPVSQHRLQ